MSKYIVTGGAGFIGSHLTDLLISSGHEVIVIDDFSIGSYVHPQARTVKANLLEEDRIKHLFNNIDGCFHLVGIPSAVMDLNDWFHIHEVNLKASLIVMKQAILAGKIPVVYASSCAVYGEATELPLKENLFVRPLCSYGADKLAIELNAYTLSKNYQLPTMGLRFFNVYGPRQNPNSPYSGVISRFINCLIENKAPIIYGDGHQTRDFIFVKDLVHATMKAMSIISTEGQIVNLATGKATSINELAQEISKIMEVEILPEYQAKRSYDVTHSLGCTEKMNSLGFKLNYGLSMGLKETIDFMSQGQKEK